MNPLEIGRGPHDRDLPLGPRRERRGLGRRDGQRHRRLRARAAGGHRDEERPRAHAPHHSALV